MTATAICKTKINRKHKIYLLRFAVTKSFIQEPFESPTVSTITLDGFRASAGLALEELICGVNPQ